MRTRTVGALLSVLLFAGASAAGEHISYRDFLARNRTNISKLSLGMTKGEVKVAMGDFQTATRDGPIYNPWTAESFINGEDTFEVFFYLTRRHPPFTPILKHQAVSVVFKNGALVAWGRNAEKQFR